MIIDHGFTHRSNHKKAFACQRNGITMKKIFAVLFLCLSALFILTACGGEEQPQKLSLYFTVDGQTFVLEEYVEGQTVKEPKQIPEKDGYVFNGWYYDEGTWSQPFNVTDLNRTFYSGSYTLYARFETVQFALNADGMGYTVTGPVKADFSGELSIPSRYLGRPVTAIADNAFKNMDGITSLKIADSVSHIGQYAFAECDGLTEVTLSAGVTTMDRAVFASCSNLEKAYLGAGISEIAASTFEGCRKLTTVTPSSGISRIAGSAFRGCVSLETITIPNGVRRIEVSAFEGCEKLTSLVLPVALEFLGDKALYGCSSLTSVRFAQNSKLKSFGSEVLLGTQVAELVLPESVSNIADRAFACETLSEITFGANLQFIGEAVFANIAPGAQIHYRGSVASFENIVLLSSDWSEGRESAILCTDAEIHP